MSDADIIDRRLTDASSQLIASFSDLDLEADLAAVTASARAPLTTGRRRRTRLLAAAAAVALLAGGTLALAVVARSGGGTDSITPSDSTTVTVPPLPTSTTPATSVPPPAPTTLVTTPVIQPNVSPSAPDTRAPEVEIPPTAPPLTAADTTAPDTTAPPLVGDAVVPDDAFLVASDDRPNVLELRSSTDVVATYDVGCPPDVTCWIPSADVRGETLWATVAELAPGDTWSIARSRMVSVSLSTGEVTEHLSVERPASIAPVGRGLDGVLYARRGDEQGLVRELVSVADGVATVLATGVSGVSLSDDGRFLAVAFAEPAQGQPARFEVSDLATGTTESFETPYVDAGPAGWSPDGRFLIVDEQWEMETAWVVDPWSGSGAAVPGTEELRDGACFMSDDVLAHRTWTTSYGEARATAGTIRLTSLADGSTVGELGDDIFGDRFHCHDDGSVSYLRRPLTVQEFGDGSTMVVADHDAPVDLVRLTPDGAATVLATGDLRMF